MLKFVLNVMIKELEFQIVNVNKVISKIKPEFVNYVTLNVKPVLTVQPIVLFVIL